MPIASAPTPIFKNPNPLVPTFSFIFSCDNDTPVKITRLNEITAKIFHK
jgi:hypothetical protein